MGRDRRMVNRVKVSLTLTVTWILASVTSGQLGEQASQSWFGRVIGPLLLPVGSVVVVVAGAVLAIHWLWEHRRRRPEEIEERRPPPIAPLAWYPPAYELFGRRDELAQARERVLGTGVAVLAGVRDMGTTAVAEHLTQWLVTDQHARRVYRFDLRSRSTSEPDGPAAAAARIVAAFGIGEPADDTDEVLRRAARRLLEVLPAEPVVLLLDNVSTPEQVAWLVREWPAGGWPRLVIAGDISVGDAAEHRTVRVAELALVHLREIWDAELDLPESVVRQRVAELLRRLGGRVTDDPVAALLAACAGRPRAVKALAQEIRRLSSGSTAEEVVRRMHDDLRAAGPVIGPLERVWTAILDNIHDGMSSQAVWLLRALAELPVTGITRGAVAVIVEAGDQVPAAGDALAPLTELRLRNLVQEQGGRYRLPQEIRRPLVRTGDQEDRRAAALRAVPALVGYFAGYVEEWAGRLDVDTNTARTWFRNSEPSLRPLFDQDFYGDAVLLDLVFADLCVIADGLDNWYVREQRSHSQLGVNRGLYELALRVRREDVAALAANRIAAAHRLARRFGDTTAWLDIAQSHAKSTDDRTRAELEARERVERALLAASGPEPDTEAIGEAMAGLATLRAAGRRLPGHAVRLVNLGVLAILGERPGEALECLREAEKVARDARDTGSEAHSVELQGTALAMRDGQLVAAVRCWQRARTIFGRIGENAGEARCLVNLAAAALNDVRLAGLLRFGRPTPLSTRDAAAVVLPLLERAKALRTGQPGTDLIDHYLDQARQAAHRT
ncbi:hypothetical protein [Actinophytocola sediminis]